MALCSKCHVSYPASLGRCPDDGEALVISDTDREDAIFSSKGLTETAAFTSSVGEPAEEEEETELTAGVMVGEYRIDRKLGQGGMGTVFAGEHPVIGKKVAIKVLKSSLSQDATIVQRFIQEARAVNQIGHRNIIDIFAFGRLPSGRHYFVMEFLPGCSLKDRLRSPPPLTFRSALAILMDMCSALASAHAEGIIHRDLKPENLFLADTKGGEALVKLLDFGVAKLVRSEHQRVDRTGTGVVIGTPMFMSPEQCIGRSVDARTDTYSAGVMMFEIFTGQLPFPGPSYAEVVAAHLNLPPPWPLALADMPLPLAELIVACLAKNPEMRPQTITEVRDRLSAIAEEIGAAVGARPVGVRIETLGAAPAQSRTPPSHQMDSAGVAAPVARSKSGIPSSVLWVGATVLGVLAIGGAGLLALRRSEHPAERSSMSAPSTVEVQVVSEPPGAEVLLDGRRQTLRTPSVFRVPHTPSLEVTVTKDGYQPRDEVVKVADEDTQKSVLMILAPLKVPNGRLAIVTDVKRAMWKLDGIAVGGGGGALLLDDVVAGEHRVSVEAKGRQRREEGVVVKRGELSSLEWTLVPQPIARGKPSGADAAIQPPPAAPIDPNGTSGWPPR